MKVPLMHRDRDFDPHLLLHEVMRRDRDVGQQQQLSPHERALIQDLELETLLHAMAGGDEFLFDVAPKAILSGLPTTLPSVKERQTHVIQPIEMESALARERRCREPRRQSTV